MEKTEISLKIPSGYRIIERTKEVDLYTAYEILRSRKHKHITSAKRVGDKALLTSHRVVCPHCGKEAPAYKHYMNKHIASRPKNTELTILNWANIQISMLGEPDEELKIQEFEDFSEEYICPKCGYSSNKSNDYMELNFNYINGKLYMKKDIKSLSELVSMRWLKGSADIDFPLYEQVIFDFDGGVTYLELISNDKIICSTVANDLSDDALVTLVSENKRIKRTLKKLFEEITLYKLPFTTNELDYEKFVNFLCFNGFPKDFYETIPFWKGTRTTDDSFKDIITQLKNPQCAMKLLGKSSIPFCKSVKRVFVNKSGLFFYLKECEFLYGLFNDVNLFCKFLEDGTVFCCLARLHYEVAVKDFLTEYSKKVGKIKTFKVLSENRRQVFEYGINYCALSDYAKLMEQESWGEDSEFFENFRSYDRYYDKLSVPMASLPGSVRDCVIGKYNFKALKTKMDYIVAGEKLKNCLGNWLSCDNPVVVVSIGQKMVAAIEINKGEVFQMRRKCNQTVSTDSELYKTTSKWCKKCNIILDPEKIDGPFIR